MPDNKKNPGYFLKTGIILLLIASVTATLIAVVNALTKDRISENEFSVLRSAVDRIYGEESELNEISISGSAVDTVYEVTRSGDAVGFCIRVTENGFKDEIKLVVLTDRTGKCLAVEIASISDTPGVGTKVTDQNYLSGFAGRNKSNIGEYDTITGATISSSAVKRAVAEALSLNIYYRDDQIDKPVETDPIPETEPIDPTMETHDETEPQTEPQTEPVFETDEGGETKPLTIIRVIGEVTVTMRETTAPETPGESTTAEPDVTDAPETPAPETEPVDPTTSETENTDTPDVTDAPPETGGAPDVQSESESAEESASGSNNEGGNGNG